MSFTSFEELDCWKACRDVQRFVRKISKGFPKEERYDLTSNIIRAARSGSRNIAESFGRFSYGEKVQSCIISRGSLYEIIDDLITALEENYISNEEYRSGREMLSKAIALVNGYINYLERAQSGNTSKAKENNEEYTAKKKEILFGSTVPPSYNI